jgi:hypothetical protein
LNIQPAIFFGPSHTYAIFSAHIWTVVGASLSSVVTLFILSCFGIDSDQGTASARFGFLSVARGWFDSYQCEPMDAEIAF